MTLFEERIRRHYWEEVSSNWAPLVSIPQRYTHHFDARQPGHL